MASLSVTVTGLDLVQEAFARWPQQVTGYLASAGKEGAEEILTTTGLRSYPGAGPGNAPPTPYYVRGQGTQYASRNDGRSERYGTQFYVESQAYTTTVGNRASYARWLAGEEQARHMAAIGWRKLLEVAEEKLPKLEAIYQGWIDKMLKDLGLI
jgi:hypothetical protein